MHAWAHPPPRRSSLPPPPSTPLGHRVDPSPTPSFWDGTCFGATAVGPHTASALVTHTPSRRVTAKNTCGAGNTHGGWEPPSPPCSYKREAGSHAER